MAINEWYGDKPTGDPSIDVDWMGPLHCYGRTDDDDDEYYKSLSIIMSVFILAGIIICAPLVLFVLLVYFYPPGAAIELGVVIVWSIIIKLRDRFSKPKKHTSASGSIKICPKCGQPMQVKIGKYGLFWGCTAYPSCTHTDSYKSLPATSEKECPERGGIIRHLLK